MTTDITELAQSLKAAAIAAKELAIIARYSKGRAAAEKFYALANPNNVIALVEALEKAQKSNEFLKGQLSELANFNPDWDKLEASYDSWREIAAELLVAKERIAELESRTVKLPPELYTIGELIRTQDNRITDQPIFIVFQKREIIGSDEHSPSRICWVWDGEEVSELRAKRLEALYQDGRDTRGYDRYAMQEVDEFVTACFTEHGCKDYLRQNGHNLRQPYIYACGSFRNNEYQKVRNWLAGIKWEGA
ncbi:ead/Ea22-like family protein [Raoultella ornithinolytica]|uniref:ead/Ea22-like family protein n=1 Tax=Raoultella ornithinolytica TaxID=54291 RepID=UPI00358DF1DD